MIHPFINDFVSFQQLGPGDYLIDMNYHYSLYSYHVSYGLSYFHWVILSEFGISKNKSL